MPHPNQRVGEYVTLYGKEYPANIIKIRIWQWEYYCEIPGKWANIITSAFISKKGRQEYQSKKEV